MSLVQGADNDNESSWLMVTTKNNSIYRIKKKKEQFEQTDFQDRQKLFEDDERIV